MSTSSILSDSDADMDSRSDSGTPHGLVSDSDSDCSSEPGLDCSDDESSDIESIDGFD